MPEGVPSATLSPLPTGSTGAGVGDGDGGVGVAEGDAPGESDADGVGVCDGVGGTQLLSVTAPAAPVDTVPPTNVTAPYVARAVLT